MDWEDVLYTVFFVTTVLVLVWVVANTISGLNNHYSIQGYWIDEQHYYTVQKPNGEKVLLKEIETYGSGND